MENAVEKAIRLLGGTLNATLKTGIHPTTLWKWAQKGKIKDGARAIVVSRATGGQVSVEDLVGFVDAEGGKMSATYQASSLSPDPAHRADAA